MMTLDERLIEAERKMRQPAFMENKGLGNEVGYYIFDYDPKDELHVREWVKFMQKKYGALSDSIHISVFDLYNVMMDILQGKGYIAKCEDMEKKGFDRLSKAIGSTLRITSPDNLIIKHIKENMEPGSIIFLTGIGKCYPLLRSHTVLNNMHLVINDVPVVMFYPGKYSGLDLHLFDNGKDSGVKDENYYRAFKLVD